MIYLGFLLFIVLEYARPGKFVPILDVLHLNSVVPLLVIVGTFVTRGPISHGELLKESNAKAILFFLGLIICSVLLADVTLYSYTIFTAVVGYVLIFWVIGSRISTMAQLKGVFATLVLVHVYLALLTPEMFTDPDGRHYLSAGTFLGDGNDYALSVNVALPLCLFLIIDTRAKLMKLLWTGVLLLLVFCVVMTKSRGGTLALGAIGFYYWLKSERKMLTGGLVGLAMVMVLVSAPSSYWERMSTIASHEDGSSQGRLTAWGAGVRMAVDHPVFGVGAGHFPVKFGSVYKPPGQNMPWLTAHSIYFLILGELGLPGISTLIFLIAHNLSRNRRVLHQLKAHSSPEAKRATLLLTALSASLLAYAVAGAFLSAAYYPHIFVISGLLIVGRRLAQAALADPATERVDTAAAGVTYHWALRPVLARTAPVPRQIANH